MFRVFRSTKLRYAVVGVAALMVGSATVAIAAGAPAVGSIFSTFKNNNLRTTPCNTTGNPPVETCVATVDENGDLHVTGTTAVTGTVNVSNVNDGRQPFQHSTMLTFPSTGDATTIDAYRVPAGRELVIESISIVGGVDLGQKVLWTRLEYDVAGAATAFFYVPMTDAGPAGSAPTEEEFVGTELTRLYVVPGGSIQIFAARSALSGSGFVNVEVSGYLI